jgi:hypothetical protein
MAQYDLILTQNTAPTGTEYSEKFVNLAKGSLLSAIAGGVPAAYPVGTDAQVLSADSLSVTGLKWITLPASHVQNTDTGTTNAIFELNSSAFKIELTAESASKFGVKVDGGLTYADLQAKDATFASVSVSAAPTLGAHLTNKTYVDGLLSSSDAMVFKGTIGTGGTSEIAAFNTLATYNAGWTYKVITAGTIKGKVCEIGDLVMATIDRTGSGNLDTDFVVAQTNIDGAVVGPASVTDNYVALFDGATGKLLKAGTGVLGTAAYVNSTTFATAAQGTTADNAISKSIFTAADQMIIGSGVGTYDAKTKAEVQTYLGLGTAAYVAVTTLMANWVTAPASKTAAGTAGQQAYDSNYTYLCTQTGTAGNAMWKRCTISTNW